MRQNDELKPGVDKPTRLQYVIGTVIIVIVSLGAYWWLSRHYDRESAPVTPTTPDSVAAATTALDTLRRLGARDYVVDSLVRRADTVTVWAGPRVWMATDRPTSAVSVVAPGRIVSIRQILGG